MHKILFLLLVILSSDILAFYVPKHQKHIHQYLPSLLKLEEFQLNQVSWSPLSKLLSYTALGSHKRKSTSLRHYFMMDEESTILQEPTPSVIAFLQKVETSDSFASNLYAFALRKACIQNSDKVLILSEISKRCHEFSAHDAAQVLWSMGTLNIPLKTHEISYICDILLNKLDSDRRILKTHDISLALMGLARLGVKLQQKGRGNNFNGNVKLALSFLSSLSYLAQYMDAQQVANIVWSMGKIGIVWDEGNHLDVKVKKAVLDSIRTSASKMSAQGVSNTIHGVSISEFSTYLTSSIHVKLV